MAGAYRSSTANNCVNQCRWLWRCKGYLSWRKIAITLIIDREPARGESLPRQINECNRLLTTTIHPGGV